MKKWTAVFLVFAWLCSLTGCGGTAPGGKPGEAAADKSGQSALTPGSAAPEEKTGEVVSYGGDPLMFELACEDGSNYGFVIDERTELVWEDRSAFSLWEDNTVDYDDWDVFSCSLFVTVVPGAETESADEIVDECVEGWYAAKKITVTGVDDAYFAVCAKPVIYLYPETETEVTVRLDYDGDLTCTYPRYEDGWRVTAQPDGTLTDASGQTYNYLYWEGVTAAKYDFSKGFCVAGEDTADFLEWALARLGLNRREANEFIVYWLPQMEVNPYNLITFQSECYTSHAGLTVTPEPDTELRVFMVWRTLTEAVEIAPQALTAPERSGFTLVEWGGARVEEDAVSLR